MKAAIVTGASSGIGMEISRILLENHYKVFGFGRDFSGIVIEDRNFYPIICDLTEVDVLTEKVKEICSKEEIHTLVNNAGAGYFGPHEELNGKKIHEMVITNLEVPMIITQLVLRQIKENAGYIFNISSVTGLTSFSKSLFDEVRKYGVKVVTIHPDMTRSNFYRHADFCEGETEDTYLTPEETAKAVEFILTQRDGMVITELTLQPQKHQIRRINIQKEE